MATGHEHSPGHYTKKQIAAQTAIGVGTALFVHHDLTKHL